ncbi:YfhO family protein [Roseburia sp. 831b]|uniref:YfhO family protein n=1 Tax=Roseburia sp. 831b TaxID=1261635 RepID=UPI000951881E|nr:YfhO family protein [Roseburia sp. 831b]WVK73497.1 YfhO family protein [Roseburia sp. 831b]
MYLQKEKWKKRMPLLAAFFLPLLISILVCIDHSVYPFGEECILHVDMYHQYCPFFTELMQKLKSGGSLLYSFHIGLGSDFTSLFAYYLASPMNWLLLIWPKNHVIEFMTILILLKIALSGLAFGYYLREHFGKNDISLSLFATAYALSGFVAAYSWNIMWMDCIFLTPLIVLGLERLVKEEKCILYTITLALSILTNYYISIMICLFLVLYFVILWFEERKNKGKSILWFTVCSLLAGGMGAVLLIPEIKILGYSGSSGISFPKEVEWYFNIIAELSRSCVITEPYTGRDHWPNIYCGVWMLLFVVLYILNRKISWKKKIPRVLLLAFFVVSFANNMLDFIWHGLHFPDSLPGRQSFLFIFLLLCIGYETFLYLKGTKLFHIGIALVVSMLLLLAGKYVSDETLVDGDAFIMTAVLLGCYAVILVLYLTGNRGVKRGMRDLLFAVMIVELTLNFDLTGLDTTSRSAYVASKEDYQNVLDQISESEEKENDAVFYRVEELERKTKNDAALYQYNSATQFSSLMNIQVSHFYRKLGMEGGKNFYCINGATPLSQALLSVKYVIADNPDEAGPLRSLVAHSGNAYVYENKYSLPLGFMVEENVEDNWNLDIGNEMGVLNQLADLLDAKEEMFTKTDGTHETTQDGETTFVVQEDGYLYATYENRTVDNLTEKTSDGRTRSFTKCSHGYTLELGYLKAGTTVSITNEDGACIPMQFYTLNEKSVQEAFETLNSQTMKLTSFSDTKVSGEIEVTKAGRFVVSIPNEEGWTLFVDGKKVETQSFADTFLSVPLEKGTHQICLTYCTPGLKEGAAISLASVVIFWGIVYGRRKRKNERTTIVNEKEMCEHSDSLLQRTGDITYNLSGDYGCDENDSGI